MQQACTLQDVELKQSIFRRAFSCKLNLYVDDDGVGNPYDDELMSVFSITNLPCCVFFLLFAIDVFQPLSNIDNNIFFCLACVLQQGIYGKGFALACCNLRGLNKFWMFSLSSQSSLSKLYYHRYRHLSARYMCRVGILFED